MKKKDITDFLQWLEGELNGTMEFPMKSVVAARCLEHLKKKDAPAPPAIPTFFENTSEDLPF